MKDLRKALALEQLDKKMEKFEVLAEIPIPLNGWINLIRTTLNMSLRQLGKRLNITSQSVKEIEMREAEKKITLEKLNEVAEALNLNLVYGFIPKDKSLEKMIENKSLALAKQIVLKTSHSMALEDQQNEPSRIEKAIKERALQIQNEMPKYLWD
ncbi:MAG: mobile mystery protein A [Melioribacteraceae bacterium]|jgi:predicted DNA-binding mobile mystery protein A|nr:mobile mystery protein A [Melioribacteraceae bacterium]